MTKRFLSLILIILSFLSFFSQEENQFLDERDGRIYSVKKIGKTIWFAENLKFETTYSHCPNFNKKKCKDGNFYNYFEKDSVCPVDWRLPNSKDWNSLLKTLHPNDSLEIQTIDEDGYIHGRLPFPFDLFYDNNVLNFETIGWANGKKIKSKQSMTHWLAGDNEYWHTHIYEDGYIEHSHEFKIQTNKISNNRKMAIRCIK